MPIAFTQLKSNRHLNSKKTVRSALTQHTDAVKRQVATAKFPYGTRATPLSAAISLS